MIYMYIKNEYVEKLIIFVEILLMLGENDVVCIKWSCIIHDHATSVYLSSIHIVHSMAPGRNCQALGDAVFKFLMFDEKYCLGI